MSKSFEQSKDEIARLCQYFTTNRKSFLAPGVKEAHVRQSLIDPVFRDPGLGHAQRRDGGAAIP